MRITVTLFLFFLCITSAYAQKDSTSFRFSGQASMWGMYTPNLSSNFRMGGRYVPQMNFKIPVGDKKGFDFEASANLFGDLGFAPYKEGYNNGKIKPYRVWTRYSSKQMELRIGLQKINFGSATMFRPLMWFDKLDSRDPLQLTDGVYGLLFRYYFPNNTNLWFWGLYGNNETKGWEFFETKKHAPEAGARLQIPVSKGEMALSYHLRKINLNIQNQNALENRIGFDMKFNWTVGAWFETSWTTLNCDAGVMTNQLMATWGGDYTFNIGNGLTTTFEQTIHANDKPVLGFNNTVTYSGLSLSYPIGILDELSSMVYYNWENKSLYNFVSLQRKYDHFSIHLMGYWNPKTTSLIQGTNMGEHMSGKGLQLMLVWNY